MSISAPSQSSLTKVIFETNAPPKNGMVGTSIRSRVAFWASEGSLVDLSMYCEY